MSRFLRRSLFLLALPVAVCSTIVRADEPAKPDERPRVIFSSPLGVIAGSTTKVVLRGQRLDDATEVKTTVEGVTIKVLSKGKQPVPQDFSAESAGDALVEIELTVPAENAPATIPLEVIGPKGTSAAYSLECLAPAAAGVEKEPNDGFKQASELPIGQVVFGLVQDAKNVDVYRLESTAGKTLKIDVIARSRGSLCDPAVTIYDSGGRVLATADDDSSGIDVQFDFVPSADGPILLVVYDANDRGGGNTHPYRLRVVER